MYLNVSETRVSLVTILFYAITFSQLPGVMSYMYICVYVYKIVYVILLLVFLFFWVLLHFNSATINIFASESFHTSIITLFFY